MGRYHVLRPLGHGGMAELYVARSVGAAGFEKRVALKLLLPHLANDGDFVAMFLDEARYAALLDHPNIASVLDLGRDDGEYYIAMEYVDGLDLRTILHATAEQGPMPMAAAVHVALSVAGALQHAHDRRDTEGRAVCLLHRDVSPSNILVRRDGEVKLVDFGLVKAQRDSHRTASGVLKGKLGYMAPEALRGDDLDARSDVFGLGVVLYEMLTGTRCFHADNEFAIMNRIAHGEYTPPLQLRPDLPARLDAILARALAIEPCDRMSSAEELRQALLRFCADHGVHPRASDMHDFIEAHGLWSSATESTSDALAAPLLTAVEDRQDSRPSQVHPPAATTVAGDASVRAWPLLLGVALAIVVGAVAWWVMSSISLEEDVGPLSVPADRADSR